MEDQDRWPFTRGFRLIILGSPDAIRKEVLGRSINNRTGNKGQMKFKPESRPTFPTEPAEEAIGINSTGEGFAIKSKVKLSLSVPEAMEGEIQTTTADFTI
jgi:hypothetical protein